MSARVWVTTICSVFVVAACTASGDTVDGGSDDVTTTVGMPAASAVVTGADQGPCGMWRSMEDPPTFGGTGEQEIWDIAASGGTWVAVGLAQGREAVDVGRADAAVWVSRDGSAWERVGSASVFDESGSQSMLAVTAWGSGFIAVGAAERTHQDDPAVWLSDDGYSWTRVEDSTGAFGAGTFAQMWDVVAGGPGLVAVGFLGALDTFDAAVWVSSDGTTWERVEDDALTGVHNEFMAGAAVTDDGRILVVGSEERDGLVSPAVWISDDGRSWERSAGLGSAGNGSIRDVTVADEYLVAVGRDGSGDGLDAAVWVSPDGYDWERIESRSLGGPGDQALAGVTVLDSEIIAVGYERRTDRDAAVWRSSDATDWIRCDAESLSVEGFQELFAVTASPEATIAVGYTGDIGEWNAGVWRRTP